MHKGAIALAALAFASSGQAANLEMYGSRVTAINAIELAGGTYNVTFDYTTYAEAPAGAFLFLNDQLGAVAAASAINALLESVQASDVGPAPAFGEFATPNGGTWYIPYESTFWPANTPAFTTLAMVGGPWRIDSLPQPRAAEYRDHVAVFTPVPVPSALWLFGAALAAFPLIRRR